MTAPAPPPERRIAPRAEARVGVPPASRYTGELPVVPPARPSPLSESMWRNVAMTLATVLLFTVGGVVIFWPRNPPGRAGNSAAASTNASRPNPTATRRTGSPSDLPMPVGDLPGWHQTFADDFTGADASKRWFIYEGAPGGDPGGWFLPSHVTQGNGRLLITGSLANTPRGTIYATGGVSNAKVFSQTYGRFDFRFRMDMGYGVNFALLLWPSDNTWPPEVNVAESNGVTPKYLIVTLHYGPRNSMIHRYSNGVVDYTQWHTAGVIWEPGKLIFTLDGNGWSSIASPNVPKVPMSMAIQTQAWPCSTSFSDCPNSTTPAKVNLEVDWAVAYKPA
jgi:beta-glucanase (GH16 family)